MIAIKRPKTKAQTEADAVDLENSIIESAKTLKKNRRKLRLGLAKANQERSYHHIPGKNFTSFAKYLEYLAPKTQLKAKHLRKLAKAGAAEMMLNDADITTLNTSDSPLIALYQNVVSETAIVDVYRKAQADNELGAEPPSKLQIIKAAEELGVYRQKTNNDATDSQCFSKKHTDSKKKPGNKGKTDKADKTPPSSQDSGKVTNKPKDKTAQEPPQISRQHQGLKSNTEDVGLPKPKLAGKAIVRKFCTQDSKAMAALISQMTALFANLGNDKAVVDESMRIMKEYPLNEWGEISETISRSITKIARSKINQERSARKIEIKNRRRHERLIYLKKLSVRRQSAH